MRGPFAEVSAGREDVVADGEVLATISDGRWRVEGVDGGTFATVSINRLE